MFFVSNVSFVYILAFILLFNIVRFFTKKKQILNGFLLLGSVIILNTICTIQSIGIIIALSFTVYHIGKKLSNDVNYKRMFLRLSIASLIILFCLKNYHIASFNLLQRVGLSYILFRLIHFLIESSRNEIRSYSAMSFINYIIFFPSFMAGPIDEYNNFDYWIEQRRGSYRIALAKVGIFKVSLGIFKKFLLVPIIVNYSLDYSLFDQNLVWQDGLLISLLLYSFYILFDFSGYSDIAIGTAYLIGIRTPENFNNPYGAKNLSVFWKKWHMTFSNFLFRYVFKPFVVGLSVRFKNTPRLVGSSIGYLFTFTICGLWHGNTLNFVYWGLWHAVGLILFKLWDVYIFKKKISPFKNSVFERFYNVGAIIITFTFVTGGWFFFNYQHKEIHTITQNIFSKNDKNLTFESVKYDGKNCLELTFVAQNLDDKHVDIEFQPANQTESTMLLDVPISASNKYYILKKDDFSNIVQVRIRSKGIGRIGNWHSGIYCGRQNSYSASTFQHKYLGLSSYSVKNITSVDTLLGTELFIEKAYRNQKIIAESRQIPGYGMAISLQYMAMEKGLISVEFKLDSNNWVNYTSRRPGMYDFVDIHGNEIVNGTSRNLKPGNYKIRLQYIVDNVPSKWFYCEINIPRYADK